MIRRTSPSIVALGSVCRILGPIGFAAWVVACGERGVTAPEPEITGTYTLQTINSSPLPFTVYAIGDDKLEVLDGSVTLNMDNTFSDRITLRYTEGDTSRVETELTSGKYARDGSALVFHFKQGGSYTGSVEGRMLRQFVSGYIFGYAR